MAAFSGALSAIAGSGTVAWTGTGTIDNVVDIMVKRSVALHDTTIIGKQERMYVRGLGTSEGTLKCLHDTAATVVAPGSTGTLTCTLYTGRVYTILIIIESVDVDYKTDGTCDVTYSWKQTGTGAATDFIKA